MRSEVRIVTTRIAMEHTRRVPKHERVIQLDNTRRARVAPKGLLKVRCNGGYGLSYFCHLHPCSTNVDPCYFYPPMSQSATSIHDNSNYVDILSPGSPSTKWFSFRTLFWTRGFSIARETFQKLSKNRSADRFRDIGWIHARTDRLTCFSRPLYTIAPSGQ